MIGIIMAGGRGTRMNAKTEKLLLCYKRPVIVHVADSMRDSGCFERIIAATSPNSPDTKRLLLAGQGIEIFDTPGTGYVGDLNCVLRSISGTALVTPGDLPLLDGDMIRRILGCHAPQSAWTSILVSRPFLGSLGLDAGECIECEGRMCCYSGISVVDSDQISSLGMIPENRVIVDDHRIAFNINTPKDYDGLLGTA